MAWSREAAQALLLNEAFMALFEDAECPVRQEADRLTRIALDPRSSQENRTIAVSKLWGMKRVLELVTSAAEEPKAEATPERGRRGRYPIPSFSGYASPPSPESSGAGGRERSFKWTTFLR